MKFDSNLHHRRYIRLKDYDYSQAGAYFITLVTKDRTNLLGEIIDGVMRLNSLGDITRSVLLRLTDFFLIRHDKWMIMPNHIHAILWILDLGTGEASTHGEFDVTKPGIADAPPLQVGYNFFYLGEELFDGALHPSMQGVGRKRAAQAGATQANLEHFSVVSNELN
jgi:hypothetical protein